MPSHANKVSTAHIQEQAISILSSQPETFPTLRQLAQKLELEVNGDKVPRSLSGKSFLERVLLAKPRNLDAPVALIQHADRLAQSESLLQFAILQASQKLASPFQVKQLVTKAGLNPKLKARFADSLRQRIADKRLPENLVSVIVEPLKKEEVVARLIEHLKNNPSNDPIAVADLLQALDFKWQDRTVQQAVRSPAFKSAVILFPASRPPVQPEWRVAHRDHVAKVAQSQTTFQWAIQSAGQAVRGSSAFRIKDLAKRLPTKPEPLRPTFIRAVEQWIAARTPPKNVGCLRLGKDYILFRLEDVIARDKSVAPPPSDSQPTPQSPDLEAIFQSAFDRCDRETGSRNFVKLLLLRQALSDLNRETFDSALHELRRRGIFTLNSAEGNVVALTEAERDAGIVEGGVPLVYVSRR